MIRILIVSTGRADVGILTPILKKSLESPKLDTHLLLTGMHTSDDTFARDYSNTSVTVHKTGADIVGVNPEMAVRGMGVITESCGRLYARVLPDIIFITGDRLDMFPCAVASTAFNIPLAHLHGGEITIGAIDDRLRHALTKLSHIHFTSTVDSAQRICRMGEEPWRINISGAPGLDTILSAEPLDRGELMTRLGFDSEASSEFRLVCLHPETNSPDPQAPLRSVLEALDVVPKVPTVFTAPNSDPGGPQMRQHIKAFVASRPWAVFHENLGSILYSNCLRHASLMIGNSSSGIIEAPVFSLPYLNVGGRQGGRLYGNNVIHVENNSKGLAARIMEIQQGKSPREKRLTSLYGDGNAAKRIISVLEDLPSREVLLKKTSSETHFSHFTAPWDL